MTNDTYGTIAITGKDAEHFLQGQLTADATQAQHPLVAALLNPKGRALALGWLRKTEDSFLWIMPAELISPTITHLKRFVLRSQVSLTDASANWQVCLSTEVIAGIPCLPAMLQQKTGWFASLMPAGTALNQDIPAFHLACLQATYPTLSLATRERFTPHELNLLAFEGVSFTKGCYTGQEIVARMHYRGKPKTALRTVNIKHLTPTDLEKGASLTLVDSEIAIELVDYQCLADNNVLALVLLPHDSQGQLALRAETGQIGIMTLQPFSSANTNR